MAGPDPGPGFMLKSVKLQRGLAGLMPFASVGTGPPLVGLPGLSPFTGIAHDSLVRSVVSPLAGVAGSRQIFVLNRHERLAEGMTMAELAAEHARALQILVDEPVDLVGTSTGGSIAQQLAADRPELVRRLVIVSSACRLDPETRRLQGRVAELVRADNDRPAMAAMAGGVVPPWRGRTMAGAAAYLVGPLMLRDRQGLADMATTIEAEDAFDLADLATVPAPTLIVAAGRDRFYPLALFEETARLIPRAQLRVFPRRGHLTVLSDPRARATLAGFLLAPGQGERATG